MAKNIVLLSDGTGNAASSIWRTNVWRMFQSVDLTGSEQVACYDDGVGTSAFKPLAILGGAFGWGLKRNVIHLYKFLCRNYTPDSKIYAFGFSRGAFTIRVLMGLVAMEGLIPYTTEDDLDGKAIAAYREFRRARYRTNAGALLRPLRDLWVALKNVALARERYNAAQNVRVAAVRFLGLWDTVAAYGLPVDEWTIGIDRYLWPLELPDRKLWPAVERAFHALSLDDERTTFHPVLWDEHNVTEGKITQVWFSGMHANVGGGYPDDSLAGVPLLWIMQQAEAAGLKLKVCPQQPDALLVAKSARDKDGRLYDSRAGLASYYRYGPRDVAALCLDNQNGVKISLPKIHESVFARMTSEATAYAPIGLPKSYVVAKEDGTIVPQGSLGVETIGQAETRYGLQQLVWNAVWWRRVVYFLTVGASLHLVLFPLFHAIKPPVEYTTALRFISEVVRVAGAFLPNFVTTWWLDSFATNPLALLISVLAVALPTLLGVRLETVVEDRMLAAWQHRTQQQNLLKKVLDGFVQGLRTASWYRAFIQFLKYRVAPLLFALATVAIVFAFVSHLIFYFEDAAGLTCTPSPNAELLGDGQTSEKLTFSSGSLCGATGIKLTAGKRYIIKVEDPKGWQDNDYPADLRGYDIRSLPSIWDRTKMVLATPLRRVLLRPWFRVIARVGEKGTDEYFLDPDANSSVVQQLDVPFYPHRSGELYLYVNDAVLPIFMDAFYRNNKGTATVTVTQRGPAAH
jgi:uncharacterized protein (DUF2235 family)